MFEIPNILKPLGAKLLNCFSNKLLRSFDRVSQQQKENQGARSASDPGCAEACAGVAQARSAEPGGEPPAGTGEALKGARNAIA